VPPNIKSP